MRWEGKGEVADPMEINWEGLLSVDDSWVTTHLCEQLGRQSPKLVIRAYSIKFSGTQQRIDSFLNFVTNQIDRFCFSPKQIDEFAQRHEHPWREAQRYFGDITPNSDGKLGELLLYLFVEAILRAPLVAHKVTFLTNPNDQVKGSDGIFLGDYDGQPAILVGESKIRAALSTAVQEALEALERFHDTSAALQYEITIASRMTRDDLSPQQLHHIANKLLVPSAEEHQACIKVHPILIVYKDVEIHNISVKATTQAIAEALMGQYCETKLATRCGTVDSKLTEHPRLAEVHLDFFLVPVSDVNALRETFYRFIHAL